MDAARRSNTTTSEAGFTLTEVIVAVVILASSLTVLLGLQSSSMQKAIRDRQQQQAMLLARSILAAIEADPDSLKEQETSGKAAKLIENLGGVPASELPDSVQLFQDQFLSRLRVDEFEVPPFTPNALPIKLRRALLTVYWSDLPEDQLQIVYVVPKAEEE